MKKLIKSYVRKKGTVLNIDEVINKVNELVEGYNEKTN